MTSILSDKRLCFFCGSTINLHKHHIYGGVGRRQVSEKYGCWVYLCAEHHNMSKHSVHQDRCMDLILKEKCQREWEERFGSRDDFINTFRRSYL